jgi:hypothetical protein
VSRALLRFIEVQKFNHGHLVGLGLAKAGTPNESVYVILNRCQLDRGIFGSHITVLNAATPRDAEAGSAPNEVVRWVANLRASLRLVGILWI